MNKRYDVRPFTAEDIDPTAQLLAARHARQRRAWPALNRAYEAAEAASGLVAEVAGQESASGALAFVDGAPSAYVIGAPRADATWGPNVWVEDAGSAGTDAEAIRRAYAVAAEDWFAAGKTSHYVVVPATDALLVDAWFSLSFGLQHVHALRAPPPADFRPSIPVGLSIRPKERSDLDALAELGLVLPRHVNQSPVFSRLKVPTLHESLAEAQADFADDRFTEFVAEHDGRVVATAVGCSLELSHGNTKMMRPVSAGMLAYVAVLPDARGLGAGRALAETVLAWSRDEGYEWVATDWRSTNLEANRSWRALGFRPTFLRLHRAIV